MLQYQSVVWEDRPVDAQVKSGSQVIVAGLLVSLGLHAWFFSLQLAPKPPLAKTPMPSLQAILIAPAPLTVPPTAALNEPPPATPVSEPPAATTKPAKHTAAAPKTDTPAEHQPQVISPNNHLQGADAYRQYYSESTLHSAPTHDAFNNQATRPGSMARAQRQVSEMRNLHGDTYIETTNGQCFKALGNTAPGQPTNWYSTRCNNSKTTEEKMLENVQREMDKRFR